MDEFRCDWGTFTDVRNIVMDAPPNSKVVTLDVDAAFRRCPILPSQQHSFVIHWNSLFYLDHKAPFGAASSGGISGKIADAMSAILISKGLSPVKNWVDDFVFFRFPLLPSQTPPVEFQSPVLGTGKNRNRTETETGSWEPFSSGSALWP